MEVNYKLQGKPKLWGVKLPNLNFWGVRTPTTPTHCLFVKSRYQFKHRAWHLKSNLGKYR